VILSVLKERLHCSVAVVARHKGSGIELAAAEEVRRSLVAARESAGIEGLQVGDLGGRDLLMVLIRRTSRKLSPRKSPPDAR
jgi:hypothetical protein